MESAFESGVEEFDQVVALHHVDALDAVFPETRSESVQATYFM
jgi:hypothetical protein